jgi:beta-lactamase class D
MKSKLTRRLFMAALAVLLLGTTALPVQAVTLKDNVNLKPHFKGYDGAFVLYDVKENKYIRYNEKRCAERFAPCSTFKIFNALAGLDCKVLSGPDDKKKWDGKKRMVESWNRDQTLQSAIQESAVWYFQEVARDIGETRMKEYLEKVGYGNKDISGGITKFWLGDSLKISADEQVEFLKRLYADDLPFSKESMDTVKKLIIVTDDGSSVLRGKTGTDMDAGKSVLGWFVGYVVEDGSPYIFATNISAKDKVNGRLARTITRSLLHSLGLH